jgi:hypothetical protein
MNGTDPASVDPPVYSNVYFTVFEHQNRSAVLQLTPFLDDPQCRWILWLLAFAAAQTPFWFCQGWSSLSERFSLFAPDLKAGSCCHFDFRIYTWILRADNNSLTQSWHMWTSIQVGALDFALGICFWWSWIIESMKPTCIIQFKWITVKCKN